MGARHERFPRWERMQSATEFDRVRRERVVYTGHYLVCSGMRLPQHTHRRIGFIVSKRVGNAVVRNRIKRQLREMYRKHRAGLVKGIRLVLLARQQAARATYQELEGDWLRCIPLLNGGQA